MSQKQLYRPLSEKKLCGVCAGLAKYFDIDPTIVRIIFLILLFCVGTGLIKYLIMALVMPAR